MARRTKQAPVPSGAVEIFTTDRGLLVEGSPTDVMLFIDRMRELTHEAIGQSRSLVVDGAQLAANIAAFRQTHREYIEFSARARELLKNHGAIDAKEEGYFRSFVRNTKHLTGNLDWKPVDLSPEQALSMQAIAGQMALRAAVKEVMVALQRIEGKVDEIAKRAKAERLGAVLADRATLQPLVARVRETGRLSATDWATIASLGPWIARDVETLRSYIIDQLAEASVGSMVRSRAAKAEDLTDDLLKQAFALLVVAEQNYVLWQELRVAHAANHEPAALLGVTEDVRQQLAAIEQADQVVVDRLFNVIEALTTPTGYEGLAPLQKARLREHASEMDAVMAWFADQRHLDYSKSRVHDYADLGASLSKIRGAISATTERLLSRKSTGDDEGAPPALNA